MVITLNEPPICVPAAAAAAPQRPLRLGNELVAHVDAMRRNAIQRNVEFVVTPEYLDGLFCTQRHLCALTGVPLTFTADAHRTASVARVDSTAGYTEGNVRWVHKHINAMRANFSDEQFAAWCRMVVNYVTPRRPEWDEWFIDLCHGVKRRSRDIRTKVGCVIVSGDHRLLSEGYNSFPSGANDHISDRYEPSLKYKVTVHAEQNAFFTATKHGIAVNGARLYVSHHPCIDCARAIIQSGIREVIYDFHHDATWDSTTYRDDRLLVATLLAECGVLLRAWHRDLTWTTEVGAWTA